MSGWVDDSPPIPAGDIRPEMLKQIVDRGPNRECCQLCGQSTWGQVGDIANVTAAEVANVLNEEVMGVVAHVDDEGSVVITSGRAPAKLQVMSIPIGICSDGVTEESWMTTMIVFCSLTCREVWVADALKEGVARGD